MSCSCHVHVMFSQSSLRLLELRFGGILEIEDGTVFESWHQKILLAKTTNNLIKKYRICPRNDDYWPLDWEFFWRREIFFFFHIFLISFLFLHHLFLCRYLYLSHFLFLAACSESFFYFFLRDFNRNYYFFSQILITVFFYTYVVVWCSFTDCWQCYQYLFIFISCWQ